MIFMQVALPHLGIIIVKLLLAAIGAEGDTISVPFGIACHDKTVGHKSYL